MSAGTGPARACARATLWRVGGRLGAARAGAARLLALAAAGDGHEGEVEGEEGKGEGKGARALRAWTCCAWRGQVSLLRVLSAILQAREDGGGAGAAEQVRWIVQEGGGRGRGDESKHEAILLHRARTCELRAYNRVDISERRDATTHASGDGGARARHGGGH